MSVEIPEPFATALRESRLRDVCDAAADTGATRFGRGLARLQAGRLADARADFEAAQPDIGDAASLELARIDVLERHSYEEALATVKQVLHRSQDRVALRARALHLAGMICGKLRKVPAAIDFLFDASGIYREIGDCAGRAQVLDTLGSVHASSGRTDLAIGAYAVSLVEKTLQNDRYGMAITLGNLGRVHLQAGRLRDAIDCFELDLKLAVEVGDQRGRARMLNDLGRAWLALEDHEEARRSLAECLEIAIAEGMRDIEFFARKDMAMALIAAGSLDDAAIELDRAEAVIDTTTMPFLRALADASRGELLLARKDPRALELLEHAAHVFGEAELPDHEIPLRITLAKAYSVSKLSRMAEVCLERAAACVRKEGYDRYRRPVREAMARIGWSEGVEEETGRLPGVDSARSEGSPQGYTILERLGGGSFGEVFRAYDPLRDQIIALKRIYLGKVYDMQRRRDLLASAKLELEAASGLRHPGLVRVFAIGFDDDGNLYVVQEFVKGRPLSDLMAAGVPASDPRLVARKVQLIANALEALHRLKIVHRDLKPENILMRAPDDSPVLLDFGIAHVPGFEGGFGGVGVGGTFPYIAPELFQHAPASTKSDIFSLGVILYQWLSGQLPWDLAGKAMDVAIRARREAPPIPIAQVRPDLSIGIVHLVERLLQEDPARRPAAGEVASLSRSIVESEEAWDDLGFLSASQLDDSSPDDTTAPIRDDMDLLS